MDTKEKIIWEALELFSSRGYGAVSMREIARAVGIRESSLYNHFSGKREIFDAIVDICWKKAEEYYHGRSLPFSPGEDLTAFEQDGYALEKSVLEVFRFFFEDPWNTRFRRLLTVSQFEDQRAAELYRQLYCQYPIEMQANIFSQLMDRGIFRPADPQTLALGFYGSVFLLLNACPDWEAAQSRLLNHIRHFTAAWRVER